MPRTSRKNQARTRRRDKSVATNNANFTSEELFAQLSNGDPSILVRRSSRIKSRSTAIRNPYNNKSSANNNNKSIDCDGASSIKTHFVVRR